ncbi:kinase-like domain-containing protein [Venturia nashicola]|nr:kinase-like domain-containing protein [Venturia nashicola]
MADDDDATAKSTLLDKHDALRLVSSFFPTEWAITDIDAVHAKEITGGFMNSLQLIWRDTAPVSEPGAILIRHFGKSGSIEEPPSTNMTLSAAQQAVVYWKMSRRGWGPKIYGCFPGGRLEEYFVDSHTLTAAECLQPDIRSQVAKSYARLHSLQLPLRRDSGRLLLQQFIESVQKKREGILPQLQAVDDPRGVSYAKIFERTDWIAELKWVADLFVKHSCKITAIHGDTNHLNVLVKASTASTTTERIVLIDYETVAYNYRGFDLGGHFAERMYCYKQPSTQLSGAALPDEEEMKAFCREYLDELRALGLGLDEIDTVEHLMLEARIGRLYHYLFVNMMCTVFDELELEPVFLETSAHMMGMYERLQGEFLACHR